MNNKDKIWQLIEEMKLDAEDWEREEEVNLAEKYSQLTLDVGAIPFITCLFQRYWDSSSVLSLMIHFFFVWKDLHYQDWKQILYNLAADRVDLYEFMRFCGRILEIDIKRTIQDDKQIYELAKSHLSTEFASIQLVKTSEAGSPWTHEMFRENGMEATTLWKRLKEEGAPMKVDV